MDLATILERYGDGTVLAAGGAVMGVLFGFFAQRSRFCRARRRFLRLKEGQARRSADSASR